MLGGVCQISDKVVVNCFQFFDCWVDVCRLFYCNILDCVSRCFYRGFEDLESICLFLFESFVSRSFGS